MLKKLCCWYMVVAFIAQLTCAEEIPYPEDVTQKTLENPQELKNLEKPGEVIYRTGFETTKVLEDWFNLIGANQDKTKVLIDPLKAHTGIGSQQLQTFDKNGNEDSAGASYWFHPGYDQVYFRRYIMFDEAYNQGNLNHVGGSLYAVAGSNRWDEMGKAGIRPEGNDRFGASFEPWRAWGRHDPPGAMMLYTYWMDMKGGRDGKYYGNNLAPPENRQIVLERSRWYCLEHMIKANEPGKADGEMAAWIDGKLYIHLKGFRWRSDEKVKLKRASLGLYVHQSRNHNMVWYDDVALSTGYIGVK